MLLESLQSEATALGDRKLDTVPMCFWARKCCSIRSGFKARKVRDCLKLCRECCSTSYQSQSKMVNFCRIISVVPQSVLISKPRSWLFPEKEGRQADVTRQS